MTLVPEGTFFIIKTSNMYQRYMLWSLLCLIHWLYNKHLAVYCQYFFSSGDHTTSIVLVTFFHKKTALPVPS